MYDISVARGRSRWVVLALLGSALLVVLLGAGAWSIVHRNSHVDPRLTGVQWILTAIHSDQPVPLDRPGAELDLAKDGHFTASDGVNFWTGVYSTSSDRLTMAAHTATAVGTPDRSPVVESMSSLYLDGATSTYSTQGSNLVITTSGWTLTFKATKAPNDGAGG